MLHDNLARIRQQISQACQRSHRDPSSVTLVCVTKGVPVEVIQQAVALGVTELGENRVQEAQAKQRELQLVDSELRTSNSELLRWHLIGHLQRNKAKLAVEVFDVIHAVDSAALAEALEQQAQRRGHGAGGMGHGIKVFLQVNVSGEATKFGCQPAQTIALARAIVPLPHLRLQGLMTMAPFSENPEEARPHFRRLRELRDALAADFELPTSNLKLSMGMSGDFEVAIEEGADVVRIGTAIFKGGSKQ